MATKFNALDQFLLEDPETTPVSEYPDREDYLDAMQRQAMRDISERGQGQSFIPPSLARERRVMPASMRPAGLASPMPSLTSPLEDEAGNLPPTMQTVPDLRAPDLRSAPAAQQIKESAFGNMKLTQPAIQPVPTVQTSVQKTEGTPSAAVAKMTEGAGGDEPDLDRMLSAANWIRAMESTGSAISGKNLRSGIADALGEQARQVEALRLKRAEKTEDITREQAQYEAANLATLTTNLAAFKDRPDIVAALENMRSGAKFTKPSDFTKGVFQAVTNPPKVKGLEAGAEKTEAGTGEILARTETNVATRPGKVEKLAADTDLARARKAKIYKDMELAGARLALDERKALDEAEKTKDPYKKLESLNTIADKKEFGGFTTLAGDLSTLERIAPGFVTEGKVPGWLTREQQLLGQNWPTSTNPKVVEFLAAYGKVANEERHRQYGSAQTDGELRSFMQQLNSSPLSAGPKVLARQVKLFADAAGRVAKGRLSRYNNVFGANNVETVFAPEWKPLFDKGGVFAAQGSPFGASTSEVSPAAAPKRRPQPANTTAMRDENGKLNYVPNDQVSAAEAAGWKRE